MSKWLRLPSNILGRLAPMKISRPSTAQMVAMDALMPEVSGQRAPELKSPSAIIQWPTGSGKTLCFALPMITRIQQHRPGKGLQGLVVVPTRELAIQTKRTLRLLTGRGKANKKGSRFKVMSLLGDLETMDRHKLGIMLSELKHQPPDLAVGTPKMIRQLLDGDHLLLCNNRHARTLVLDEVDTLGNTPHWEDVERLMGDGRWRKSAVWLVSAYVPDDLAEMCFRAADKLDAPLVLRSSRIMPKNVTHLVVPPEEHQLGPNRGLSTIVEEIVVGSQTKFKGERPLLMAPEERRWNRTSGIVFTSSSEQAAKLHEQLLAAGLKSTAVHNNTAPVDDEFEWGKNVTYQKRRRALRAFAAKRSRVLVSTDMLSRGVDIKGATHVINTTIPNSKEHYMHRAGRVGRITNDKTRRKGGKKGIVVTLARTQSDYEKVLSWEADLGIKMHGSYFSPELQEDISPSNEIDDNSTSNYSEDSNECALPEADLSKCLANTSTMSKNS